MQKMVTPSSKPGRPFTVAVEGNIGSGKTTFLNYFNKYENVCVLAEPIELWRSCNGHNLLGLMYENPKQWSFTFQSYVQLTVLQHHCLQSYQPIKLMERSIYSARYCFVEKMRRDQILCNVSADVIDEHFKWITDHIDTHIDLIVYLRTSPKLVYQRAMERKRAEEKSVPFEYFKQLHTLHEDWLYYKSSPYHCPAPVMVLNANLDISCIEEEYKKCHSLIFNKSSIMLKA